ncbi:glycosyltransferase family 4 protein [Streptococcus plurextorum]|uniref:glycosyltransferase family 4 protein n=1 Tax=Streptococcus plurextorum TaxID=456876 RepID=UPI000412602F|nr:MraY family glycosyltransferase [Streptococcus plurextorum]
MASFSLDFILVLIATFCLSLLLTPIVRVLAFKIGAVDHPNARRINKIPMPSAGGLAVVASFVLATMVFMPMAVHQTVHGQTYFSYMLPVVSAGLIVAVTGLIDDVVELTAKKKLLGIILAAVLIWYFTEFRFDSFKIPFGGPLIEFDPVLTFVATILWIVGITNAVNLMDGLDGLVSGVSIISLSTMGLVSNFFLTDTNLFITLTIFILIAAIAGFLPYNYNPAWIYGGDTGALFIGFMISVLSLQGLKNATAVAVVTPVIILGVPIVDTFVAIIRRTLSGKKFYEPDKMHLHHRLLAMGFTHKGAVLVIYGIALLFSLTSLLLNVSTRLGGILLVLGLLLGLEVLIEGLEIWGEKRTPLFTLLKLIGNPVYRKEYFEQKQKK